MARKRARRVLLPIAAGVIVLFLAFTMWPRPLLVDMAEIRREPMIVTIDEEAKTRVRDEYVVSAPISGRLLRAPVEPGDLVLPGETVVARIAPTDPSFLDPRSRAEAEAAARAVEASLRVAEAELRRARAEEAYAENETSRTRELARTQTVSEAAVDRADLALRTARANRQTAEAAVRMRTAELETARARLLVPQEEGSEGDPAALTIRSPVAGQVLRVMQESETIVAAGSPIISIGDPGGDLEVLTELLSTDAVQVRAGARVIIEDWGGDAPIEGLVDRVEPYGFTKISALGVEEQRVNVIVALAGPPSERAGLGHGYRVDVRIVVWEDANALVAPASALFRDDGEWAAFVVEGGRARLRALKIGKNNGVQAEVLEGLSEGDIVVEYPGDRLEDGVRVAQRRVE